MEKVVDMTKNYLDEIDAKPGEYDFVSAMVMTHDEAVRSREMIKDLIKERLGIAIDWNLPDRSNDWCAYRTVSAWCRNY